ncbi:MAG TPA: hypothetical protein VK763_20315 [Terriglobales bacterium]|jgi:hypothetical protein|nr:hypothetical protein [Terriglobales bacterium]
MNVARFVPSFVVCVASVLLLASAVQAQSNPPCPSNSSDPSVTTWHYDNCRTGWQQNETILNTATFNPPGHFGKIMQYNVQGVAVYAQPLAAYQVSSSYCPSGLTQPCNMVFVATEQDMLYAFNADYTTTPTPTPLWSLNLAPTGTTYITCSGNNPPPCGAIKPYMGVTGTPVIDTSTGILYVVSIVITSNGAVQYWIHAVNYKTGGEMSYSPQQILATATIQAPTTKCGTATGSGTGVSFDPTDHYQRAGLLLLNGEVYVAFAPADAEKENGWLMAFSYSSSVGPHLDDAFVTTPYGTGGGIWMSGAGPAAASESGGTYIYLSVANGTFDATSAVTTPSIDYGDSVIKLTPYVSGTSSLAEVDDFTPANVFSFMGGNGNGVGLCPNDEDLGSGGVMPFPDSLLTGHPNLMIAADKQSKFYVIDRDNLTGYNPSGDTIVQELLTPQGTGGAPEEVGQGYWGSPAYWKWTTQSSTTRAIYYSVDATTEYPNLNNPPLPMNMYILDPGTTPGPLIPTVPNYSTTTAFCVHGGSPSVSSSTSAAYSGVVGTGIVWAYEDKPPNCQGSTGQTVLHAYDASNISTELYNSSALTTTVGSFTKFSTPAVFNGKVYIGTQSEVDVFGICGGTYPACFTN